MRLESKLRTAAVVVGFSSVSPTNNQESKLSHNDDGRECCARSSISPDGTVTTIVACAGWFLSDSQAAHGRACAKAQAGIDAQ